MKTSTKIACLALLSATTLTGGVAMAQDTGATDTRVATTDDGDRDMGWLGLLGLIGLAGLMRKRHDPHHDVRRDSTTAGSMR